MITFLAGLFIGGTVGFLTCGILAASGREDCERDAYLRGVAIGHEASLSTAPFDEAPRVSEAVS